MQFRLSYSVYPTQTFALFGLSDFRRVRNPGPSLCTSIFRCQDDPHAPHQPLTQTSVSPVAWAFWGRRRSGSADAATATSGSWSARSSMQSRVVSPLCQTFSAALVHSDSQALRAVENGEAIKAVLVPLELRAVNIWSAENSPLRQRRSRSARANVPGPDTFSRPSGNGSLSS